MTSLLRRTHRWAVSLMVVALLAAACGGGDEGGDAAPAGGGEQAAPPGGELSVYIGEPENLAPPSNVTENMGSEVLNALYSPLVEVDTENARALFGSEAPDAVAEDVSSDDNQTWTVTLKEGWTFHDGSPVTAQAYVDTWNYGALGSTAATGGYFFERIDGYDALQCDDPDPDDDNPCPTPPSATEMTGLRAIDDRTLEIRLAEPFSQWPLVLKYTAFFPAPAGAFATPEGAEAFNEAPVGNGPFQMEGTWEHQQRVRVRRYDNYGGADPAKAAAIDFRIYAEPDTAFNDLLAGQLDVLEDVPGAQYVPAQEQFCPDRCIFREGGNIQFLGLPTFDPRFRNPDVRHALSMAIDRAPIAETVRPDFAPANSLVPPSAAGAQPGICGEFCEYNPEGARELLESAGGWQGPLMLFFNSGGDHEGWMEAVSNNLRQNLGITDIRFETLEFAEYLPLLEGSDYSGPYRLGWIPDYPSPVTYLESLLVTDASSNYTGYSNPEYDRLVAQGDAADSIEEGITSYQQAEQVAIRDMPIIPMFYQDTQALWSERVSGVQPDFFENLNVADIEVTQ